MRYPASDAVKKLSLLSLCTVHWRYYRTRHSFPTGGAPEPGTIHPDDVWEGGRHASSPPGAPDSAFSVFPTVKP